MKKIVQVAAVGAASLAQLVARADASTPDTAAVTTAATNVGVVGAAVFAVYVAVKGFKWIRSAL